MHLVFFGKSGVTVYQLILEGTLQSNGDNVGDELSLPSTNRWSNRASKPVLGNVLEVCSI
jgi:hypothetical protein